MKNLSTRTTFEDDEQSSIFEDGDVSKYDDNTLRCLEKLILCADNNGKFLVAEMIKYNLVAYSSTDKRSVQYTAGHLGALLNYIWKAVLDIVSELNLQLAMGHEEYIRFKYRVLDTFELIGRSCKTKIYKYQAQNYKSMMKMNDEHFFKLLTKLRLSQRVRKSRSKYFKRFFKLSR